MHKQAEADALRAHAEEEEAATLRAQEESAAQQAALLQPAGKVVAATLFAK